MDSGKGPGPMRWKPGEQYGISSEEKTRMIERAKLRDANRVEFQKKIHNPYLYTTDFKEPWDPAIERYNQMLGARYKFFKWNFKTSLIVFPITLGFFGCYFIGLYRTQMRFVRKCENGEILLKDRTFKIA